MLPPEGSVSPGVAEVSAFACVVTTAVAQATDLPPFAAIARSAMTVSRDMAAAGTGLPGVGTFGRTTLAAPDPQAESARTAIMPASQTRFMTVGRLRGCAGCKDCPVARAISSAQRLSTAEYFGPFRCLRPSGIVGA